MAPKLQGGAVRNERKVAGSIPVGVKVREKKNRVRIPPVGRVVYIS